MEEEIMRSFNNQKASNNPAGGPPMPSANIPMNSKIFAGDAKRMSFDENMPNAKYGSPLSSLLSQSPGSGWSSSGNPNMHNQGRRDSLKNLWHLQDFGTD